MWLVWISLNLVATFRINVRTVWPHFSKQTQWQLVQSAALKRCCSLLAPRSWTIYWEYFCSIEIKKTRNSTSLKKCECTKSRLLRTQLTVITELKFSLSGDAKNILFSKAIESQRLLIKQQEDCTWITNVIIWSWQDCAGLFLSKT